MNKYLEKIAQNDEKGIVIVDLDDTLSDAGHRKHLIEVKGKSPNFDKFNEASVHDKPNQDVIQKVKEYHTQGNDIVIMSGRSDIVKDQTKAWLKKHNVPYQRLLMRPAESRVPSPLLKEKWLSKLDKGKVIAALDDQGRNLKMFAKHGIPGHKVKDGKLEKAAANKYVKHLTDRGMRKERALKKLEALQATKDVFSTRHTPKFKDNEAALRAHLRSMSESHRHKLKGKLPG